MNIKLLNRLSKAVFSGQIVLYFLLVFNAQGQNQELDSLTTLLVKTKESPERVDVLNELAFALYDYNDSLALKYSKESADLAIKLNYPLGLKRAYNLMGLGYLSSGEYEQAFKFFHQSDDLRIEGAGDLTSYNLNLMGNGFRDRSDYDSALFYYNSALSNPTLSDRIRGSLLKNLGSLYLSQWQNDKAIEYLTQAEELASKVNSVFLLSECWAFLGDAYENKREYSKADHYYNKLCEITQNNISYYHQIKCEIRKADLDHRLGKYSESLSHCFNALKLTEQYSYPPQMVDLYTVTGEVYSDMSQHELALRYFFEGLRISEKAGLKQRTARLYSYIGWVYKEQLSFDLALSYVNRSLELRTEIQDQHGISNCYNVLGLIHFQQKKYDEAITYLVRSREIREKIGHVEGIAAAIFNLSLVYESLGQYEKSMVLLKQAIVTEEKIASKLSLGISYNQLAHLLITSGRFDEAEKYLLMANTNAIESGSVLLMRNNASFFAQLYEARKDYKRAYEYQLQYQRLNDSIFTQTSAGKLAEMEALYQIEKKEQEIKLLNQENEIQDSRLALQSSQLRQQRLIIGFGITGFLLLAALSWNIYRSKKSLQEAHKEISEQNEEIQAQTEELTESNQSLIKLNKELVEKQEEIQAQTEELTEANETIHQINVSLEERVNERTARLKEAYKELDTFFYRSSHDFRRPLTTFMGLAEVAKVTVKDRNALELFEKVNETAHALDRMLIKLQSISDVGAQQLVYKEVFLKEMMDEIIESFREEIQKRGIKMLVKVEIIGEFCSYPAMIRIIIENLVENAIQFCGNQNPVIQVSAYQQDDRAIIEVLDNGQGIDDEVKDKIFDMYFRGSERSKGNGLGLYIIKKAVEKLNGTISWSSRPYSGTVFTIHLPMGESLSA